MRHFIIGTAGHVDHGKTALIRALTGIETDRLPEERARGMSIELGFAYFDLPDGTRAGIVDVPGHERFLSTMVSGATGMDLVLFVVSAKEGAKPQTVEHLQILDLLGVHEGILVVTMRDLVSDEELEFAVEETRELLQGTTLEGIPYVAVSSVTGEGLDDLRRMLTEAAARIGAGEPARGIARLPIDRVFTLEGFGLVVTGTLRDGPIQTGDQTTVLPEGFTARVRTVQVHGRAVPRAEAGQRTALNLVGVRRADLHRGQTIVVGAFRHTTGRVDVSLRVVEDFPRVVEHFARARLHIGADEAFCRVLLVSDAEGLLPGAATTAQLRVERDIVAVRGDRFVLRDVSAQRTIGGGGVLDPAPPRHRRLSPSVRTAMEAVSTSDRRSLLRHLLARAERPFVAVAELAPYFPAPDDERRAWIATLAEERMVVVAGESVVLCERLEALMRSVESVLREYHAAEPLAAGHTMSALRTALATPVRTEDLDWVIARMAEAGRAAREGNVVRLPDHHVEFGVADAAVRDAIEGRFREAGLAAPSPDDLAAAFPGLPALRLNRMLQMLVHSGALVRVAEDYWVHRTVYEDALTRLRGHLREHGTLGIADFRGLTGASRKYAVPFLEHCDQRGFTYRDGNARRGVRTFLALPE
jgi:selenocysteine-specific elongation factor